MDMDIFQQLADLRKADLETLRAKFSLDSIQAEGFLMTNPLDHERRADKDARRALRGEIIVRRPQIYLRPRTRPVGRRRREHNMEMQRSNLLYLVRLAPLTHELPSGKYELTPAGKFFPVLDDIVKKTGSVPREYQDKFVAKYGFTSKTVKERFKGLLTRLSRKGFPPEGYHPFYAVCIDGILGDTLLLRRVEASMRNMFDRKRLRFRQHAQGEDHPGNVSNASEMWELVLSDGDCDNTFTLMQRFAIRLDAARRCVRELVWLLDRARKRVFESARNELTAHELATFDEESVARVDVHKLYFSVLEYAAASIDI